MPIAVRHIRLKYLWIRRQGHSPLSGVARSLLQQNLLSCRALCATTHACTALYTACTGGGGAFYLCILHVYAGSSSISSKLIGEDHSVEVVYRIMCSSACIDRSTKSAILNLFLVGLRCLCSCMPSPLYAPLTAHSLPSLTAHGSLTTIHLWIMTITGYNYST